MPSSHLILCHPLLLPPIPPSIRVFSSESVLRMRWPKYWSFRFSISPSNEHPGLISFRMHWLDLLAVQLSRVFSNTTVQKHQLFGAQLWFYSNSTSTHAAAAAKSLQSCPTLCDPINGIHQAPPSLGFSRQEHWSGLPFPFPMHESEK